ncbi:HD superfamily hydrolase [Trypanosoma rangeli]|uniref:HD superfamily hydrolase n=1 Tax=Trypanosoma rangeli TaxID=5698 RepID=A0A3R7LX07_TRYRA|nr:HD superfamily hydrolase [Trypanosoma rangeli]RNF04981.1 HD superfamily hydrolase [Trypanosoma rangeli]|eukprot:RNF04981.1 HD superfamily hydrolase [Trypanosoma rangeli]
MEAHHFRLWARCQRFVGDVCAGRDATHGLAHMERVTENALLILHMEHGQATRSPLTLSRVILIAMLHDVADHKYDVANTLLQKAREFLVAEIAAITDVEVNSEEALNHALTAMEAVSFSKEKKYGMRWFEAKLSPDWVFVRDVVSDADKLEAIGEEGLRRCLMYTRHTLMTREGHQVWDAALQQRCLEAVKQHFVEKLSLLSTKFIVTPAGKFLAAPRHVAMEQTLKAWDQQGLPSLT